MDSVPREGSVQRPPYSIEQYSIDALVCVLAEEAHVSESVVRAKNHLNYFEGYFKYIKAETILVERNYTDRDYLEDFASYYVRCFTEYRSRCSRLHFFKSIITDEDFREVLNGGETRKLTDSYLGFVVVKPLPQTIIGRTCLRTYDDDNGRRRYPSTRDYEANVFGVTFVAQNTLAFQEQDRVAAACATSALWSVFQGTGKLFQHPIPSPAVITRAATKEWSRETRAFPNSGLNILEMAHAIRDVGLEPLMVGASGRDVLAGNLYAYLEARIPLLLIADLYNAAQLPIPYLTRPNYLGKHAVALTGYSLGLSKPTPYGGTGLLLKASRIDKLYAHDDQVGPFARMVFNRLPLRAPDGRTMERDFLTSSWRSASGSGDIVAQPENLLIPLYHKIRIPFEAILQVVIDFDQLLEQMRQNSLVPISNRLEWDVHLTTINEFKTKIRSSGHLDPQERVEILQEALPKFLWCAIGSCNGAPMVGLIFDATDIEQGSFFLRGVGYDRSLCKVLVEFGRALPNEPPGMPRQTVAIFRRFKPCN